MNQRNEETLAWGPVPVGLGEAHANSSHRWCLLPGWISMCSWSGYLLRNLVLSTHLKKSIFFMALIFCLCDLFFFSRSLFSIWLFVALIFKSRTKGDVTVMTYRMWSVHSLYQPTESWLMVMESEQGKLPESNALCFASDKNIQMHLSLNRDEFCTVESWKQN